MVPLKALEKGYDRSLKSYGGHKEKTAFALSRARPPFLTTETARHPCRHRDTDERFRIFSHARSVHEHIARARGTFAGIFGDGIRRAFRGGRRTFVTIESRCRSIAFGCLPHSASVHALDKFGNICIRTSRRLRLCKRECFYLTVYRRME